MRRWITVPGLVLLALLSGPGFARAAGEMDEELSKIAQQVSAFLRHYGNSTVAVGQFTCPPQLSASAGPGISKMLAEDLIESGIVVKRLADLGIKGEYRLAIQNGPDGPEAQIKGVVENLSGKQLYSFSRNVKGTAALVSLFGLTVDLPASETDEARNQRIVASLKQPQTHLKSARISAGTKSPYAIEVLVQSGDQYQPRTPTNSDGLAFVKIDRDEIYAVRLINDSDEDAAVTLTIDGLTMFAFSEHREYSYVIIPRRRHGLIKGWHITNERTDSFQVTAYSKSAVAELLPNSSEVGTITAAFAAAWPPSAPPPTDERGSRSTLRGANATGRGPSVETKYQVLERFTGVIRATVSVRYTREK
jgi:hypothetical protein